MHRVLDKNFANRLGINLKSIEGRCKINPLINIHKWQVVEKLLNPFGTSFFKDISRVIPKSLNGIAHGKRTSVVSNRVPYQRYCIVPRYKQFILLLFKCNK